MWPRRRILLCEKVKIHEFTDETFLVITRLNRSRSHFTVRKLDANDLLPSITWIHCDLTRLCLNFWGNDITNVFLDVSYDERTHISDSTGPNRSSTRVQCVWTDKDLRLQRGWRISLFSMSLSADHTCRQVLRGTLPNNSSERFSRPSFWSPFFCRDTSLGTPVHGAIYTCERWYAISRRRGPYDSVDHA
jgi:hypothetical protein